MSPGLGKEDLGPIFMGGGSAPLCPSHTWAAELCRVPLGATTWGLGTEPGPLLLREDALQRGHSAATAPLPALIPFSPLPPHPPLPTPAAAAA